MKKRTIALTLTRYGLAIAVSLGLITSAIQITQDFTDESPRNTHFIQNILAVASAAAMQAAFQLDKGLALEAAQPLMIYEFITSVTITDDRNVRIAHLTRPPKFPFFDHVTRFFTAPYKVYDIPLTESKTRIYVGKLSIEVHNNTILQDFYRRSLNVVAIGILKNVLLTALLLYLFYWGLTTPLKALNQCLTAVDPRQPEPFPLPKRIAKANNEITTMALSANHILNTSRAHLQELSEAQALTKKMTQQLRHSERLSAIGQLVGGVAHDFNNILAIIMGSLELLESMEHSERGKKLLTMAHGATDKGSKLTAQLLAYSRNQPLEPTPILAGELFHNMENLLRRALGEQYALEFVISSGLWHCFADRQALETVLLNLALNARDALPNGGNLTIEVRNTWLDIDYCLQEGDVTSGQYVCFAISDNGMGMSKETVARAFEPYFTTKPIGKGSGLGLSMAYGFAKQSGGHIKIYSEEAQGTTVKLYLPRYTQALTAKPAVERVSAIMPNFTGYCLLVVEDDPLVLEVVKAQLMDMNIQVITAPEADTALALFHSHPHIDAALLDITLPGKLNGRALASLLEAERPYFKVAFMSGYTENAIIHNARLDEGVILLQKPFSRKHLARVLSRLLNTPT
ncbi:ATP-binding protein [Thiofilum flexile]|uniref:ATP-binding protein n=1 Tax=Thiofilum flexile TaxID=125627 RepID=UPI00036F4A3A|nr:ATP-binding protein [Thiofilum flexile]